MLRILPEARTLIYILYFKAFAYFSLYTQKLFISVNNFQFVQFFLALKGFITCDNKYQIKDQKDSY